MDAITAVNTLEKMLSIPETIQHLIEENAKFAICGEEDAKIYLELNNYYYKVTSFKSNFEVYQFGELKGKYINLDFAYLKDLAIIDYRVRRLFFNITTSIEHYLKLRILNTIESMSEEDGYNIVNLFLDKDYNDTQYPKRTHENIMMKKDSEYYRHIFSKYNLQEDKKIENLPIWIFFELISFGELIRFFKFFTNYYNLEDKKYFKILKEVKNLRNAVAHNSCILSNLDAKDNNKRFSDLIVDYLNQCGICKKIRDKKLKNSVIMQMTCALYLFNEIVTSDGIKQYVCEEINELFYGRIVLNKKYYAKNDLLKSVYHYFNKIVKKNLNIFTKRLVIFS